MKALANIERIQVNNDTLMQLLSLYECKGKEFYYKDLFSRDLQSFLKKTLESDVIAIAKILDLEITDARLKQWGKKGLVPKNKDEELLKNIRQALIQVQLHSEGFEIVANEVLDLGKMLTKGITQVSFGTYETDGEGLMKKTESKRKQLEELINLFTKLRQEKKNELIHLITNLYIDFINMEILTTGNDTVGLILLYSMLAKNFNIFKYVSFFSYFLDKKEIIKTGIIQARYYWSEGYSQTEALYRIIIDILSQSYNEVEEIARVHEFEMTLNKSDTIENTVYKLAVIFSKEDIRKHHPNVSDTTIDRTLKRLRDENKIIPLNKGRGSKWRRTNDEMDKTFSSAKQLSIFND